MIFLIFIPIFLLFENLIVGVRYIFYKFGCWHQMKGSDLEWNLNFAVDEKLGNYWRSIRGNLQLRLYFKEMYQRKQMNIKQLPDDKIKILETAKRGKKFIVSNAVNYDLLGNPAWQNSFYYVTLDRRHGNKPSVFDFIPAALY